MAAYAPLTPLTKAPGGPVDPKLKDLANKYGVSENEIALRWCLDQGIVAIPTSANEQRMQSYISKIPSFKLTKGEVEDLAELGRRLHHRGFWQRNFSPNDRR